MTPENQQAVATQPAADSPVPYAGFWRRFWAFLLDGIFASLPPAVICLPLILWQGVKITQATQDREVPLNAVLWIASLYLLWAVLNFFCFWLYSALQESGKHQATFGKRILGVKVVGANGQRIGFGRATGRYFAKIVSYMIFYIGYVIQPFTHRKRALHDIIAGTYVVKASYQPGEPLPDTPSRIGWMITLAVLMTAAFISLLVAGVYLQTLQDATLARQAQALLRTQKEQGKGPADFAAATDIALEEDDSGYYAAFSDSRTSYGLFLPKNSDEICCFSFEEGACGRLGLPDCEEEEEDEYEPEGNEEESFL